MSFQRTDYNSSDKKSNINDRRRRELAVNSNISMSTSASRDRFGRLRESRGRRNHTVSAENVSMDMSRPTEDLLSEAVSMSLSVEMSTGLRQAYVNHIPSILLNAPHLWADSTSLQIRHLLMALRCLLTDEHQSLRAGSLRALRYTIKDCGVMAVALDLHIDIFVARCLDLVSDNAIERGQAFKLAVHLLKLYNGSGQFGAKETLGPRTDFPYSIFRPIIAIAYDGLVNGINEKSDRLSPAATGLLLEQAVSSPNLALAIAGTDWIIKGLLGPLGQQNGRVQWVVASLLARWLDCPRLRRDAKLGLVIQQLLAPLMDVGFMLASSSSLKDSKTSVYTQEVSNRLDRCRSVVVCLFRSWPGLLACCSSQSSDTPKLDTSPLRLLEYLGMGLSNGEDVQKIRSVIVDVCCEAVDAPYVGREFERWQDALSFYHERFRVDTYKSSLRDSFVVAEAERFLSSPLTGQGPLVDLKAVFRAVSLFILVEAGIAQSLVRLIIIDPDRPVAIKATLLLADILKSGGAFLPQNWRQKLLSLPGVVDAVCDDVRVPSRTDSAASADTCSKVVYCTATVQFGQLLSNRLEILEREYRTERSRPIRAVNLQMEMLLRRHECQPRLLTWLGRKRSDAYQQQATATIDDNHLHEIIRESKVNAGVTSVWDWKLIDLALYSLERANDSDWTVIHRHSMHEPCQKFLSQLLTYYWPDTRHGFCQLTCDWKEKARSGCRLMRLMAATPKQSSCHALIGQFLHRCSLHFSSDELLESGIFSLKNVMTSSVVAYFAFVGELSSVQSGLALLQRHGLLQIYADMMKPDTKSEYVKLIVAGLDYGRPGMARVVLHRALTATSQEGRRYATRFLRVLAAFRSSGFESWGMEMLIGQLADRGRRVVRAAVDCLNEWLPVYPNVLSQVKMCGMATLGDAGFLLLSHCFCSERFLASRYRNASVLSAVQQVVDKWKTEFVEKYVDLVENAMVESMLDVKRTIDGSFARTSNDDRRMSVSVPCPLHLYGALGQHQAGCELLLAENIVGPLLDTLKRAHVATEVQRRRMKAAIFALAHIGSSEPGLIGVLPDGTVPDLVRMAEQCPVASVRGCAIWGLNLIARSARGAQALALLGWQRADRATHGRSSTPDSGDTEEPVNINSCNGYPSRQDGNWRKESLTDQNEEITVLKWKQQQQQQQKPRSSRSLGSVDAGEAVNEVKNASNSASIIVPSVQQFRKRSQLWQWRPMMARKHPDVGFRKSRTKSDNKCQEPRPHSLSLGLVQHRRLNGGSSVAEITPVFDEKTKHDRTFTNQSVVTSGFGSLPEDGSESRFLSLLNTCSVHSARVELPTYDRTMAPFNVDIAKAYERTSQCLYDDKNENENNNNNKINKRKDEQSKDKSKLQKFSFGKDLFWPGIPEEEHIWQHWTSGRRKSLGLDPIDFVKDILPLSAVMRPEQNIYR